MPPCPQGINTTSAGSSKHTRQFDCASLSDKTDKDFKDYGLLLAGSLL